MIDGGLETFTGWGRGDAQNVGEMAASTVSNEGIWPLIGGTLIAGALLFVAAATAYLLKD